MMVTEEKVEEVADSRTIKVSDRCDSCKAQAFVLVKLVSGELMFCGHHFKKYEEKLTGLSYEIIDERKYINEKPSQSSN
jgi:hypothetical protein